jgi:hypothetical protein
VDILHNFKAVAGVSALAFLGACAPGREPQHSDLNVYPHSVHAYPQSGIVQGMQAVQVPHQGMSVSAVKFMVLLDDGTYEPIVQHHAKGVAVGDRVQIDNGEVRRY